jgi:hypothetical protein
MQHGTIGDAAPDGILVVPSHEAPWWLASTQWEFKMDIAEAFQIVLDLARQNIIDEHEMPEEHARQVEACDVLEDLAVNEYGDD